MQDDDSFVYDEASGEWISASDAAAKAAASGVVAATAPSRCATRSATCWPMATR